MREYEATIVLSPLLEDQAVSQLVEQVSGLIQKSGGEVTSVGQLVDKRGNVAAVTENWRARKLAYAIGGHREGYYVVVRFTSPTGAPDELERWLNIAETVLRFLVLRVQEAPVAAAEAD